MSFTVINKPHVPTPLQAFGKTLAEGVPKVMEQYNLSKGLKNLEKDSGNLTPEQYFTRALQIPGITPEAVRQLGEFARQKQVKTGLREVRNNQLEQNPEQEQQPKQQRKDVNFLENKFGNQNQRNGFANEQQEATSTKSAQQRPSLDPELETPLPLSPEQRSSEILDIMEQLGLPFGEAKEEQVIREQRRKEIPQAKQEREDLRLQKQEKLDALLDKQIETSLQKEGKDVYRDLTGDTLLNLKKQMHEDQANSYLTDEQLAEKWRKIGRNLVTHKNTVKELANRSLTDRILPNRREETLKKIKTAAELYNETGNSKELYDTLRTENKEPVYSLDDKGNKVLESPGSTGFGFSKGRAAQSVYPRSEGIKQILKKKLPIYGRNASSQEPTIRKLTTDVINKMTFNDSPLAIARELKDIYPDFNETAFFDVLRENLNKFNPQQKDEILSGEQAMAPTWGDIATFPIYGRSVVND